MCSNFGSKLCSNPTPPPPLTCHALFCNHSICVGRVNALKMRVAISKCLSSLCTMNKSVNPPPTHPTYLVVLNIHTGVMIVDIKAMSCYNSYPYPMSTSLSIVYVLYSHLTIVYTIFAVILGNLFVHPIRPLLQCRKYTVSLPE